MHLSDFCEATGATPKQIHYWAWSIPLTTKPMGENDRWREYDPATVPKVRLLVWVSKAFGGYFSVDTLARIFFAYEEGGIDFGGFRMEW